MRNKMEWIFVVSTFVWITHHLTINSSRNHALKFYKKVFHLNFQQQIFVSSVKLSTKFLLHLSYPIFFIPYLLYFLLFCICSVRSSKSNLNEKSWKIYYWVDKWWFRKKNRTEEKRKLLVPSEIIMKSKVSIKSSIVS